MKFGFEVEGADNVYVTTVTLSDKLITVDDGFEIRNFVLTDEPQFEKAKALVKVCETCKNSYAIIGYVMDEVLKLIGRDYLTTTSTKIWWEN